MPDHLTTPQIHVRRAKIDDVPDLVRLALEVQAVHVAGRPDIFKPGGIEPAGIIARRVGDPDHLFWIAIVDGRTVGSAYARVVEEAESPWRYASRVIVLDQMSVSAEHRSRGVGHALWDAVRAAAVGERVDRVVLNVWAFNRDARRFYERLGFAPYHERMAFELGDREHAGAAARSVHDAVVAVLDLTQFASESTRVGDTATADTLDTYYAIVAARVAGAGGRVVKFIRDAVLVVFPGHRVDDAVTVLRELVPVVDRSMRELGWSCQLVVRAHYGTVVAGNFGDARQKHFDVVGQTVNDAARLPRGDGGGVTLSAPMLERLSPEIRQRLGPKT